MSLATRCPVCGTTFRVVQDQLKVSEGWVRCGRCDEAFNALEGLFDLERDSGLTPLDEPAYKDQALAPTEPMPLDQLPSQRQTAPPPPQPKDTSVPARDLRQADYAEYLSHGRARPRAAAVDTSSDDALGTTTANDDAPTDDAAVQPDFLRRAQRAAMWRRPGVRAALAAGCLVMAAALALQWVVHQRDVLAAHRPDWAPTLAALCEPLGCKVETLRDIAAIVVDSSGLEATELASQFRFSAALRNQSAVTVATPSLDLSLTDASGQVVLRKTLMPSDFGASAPIALTAGADVLLNAVLDVGPLRVAGYTVLAYYP
jgi:predicted Zn finger-like uncharacterized protein